MLSLLPRVWEDLLSSFQAGLAADLRNLQEANRHLRETNQALKDRLTEQETVTEWWRETSNRNLWDRQWYQQEYHNLLAENGKQRCDVRISSPLTDAEAWTGLDFPCSSTTWQSCWPACPMCKRPLELTPSPAQKSCDAPLSWKESQ